jgi:HlyD family secretion protein
MENEIQNLEIQAEHGVKKIIKKFRKTKKRTKIITGVVLIIVLAVLIPLIFKKDEQQYELTEVKRGVVIEEVSATGDVEAAEEVDLKFKTGGTIESINVKIGDKVKKGTYLARLASGNAYSQYLQAQASYNQAEAKLDQLLAGASSEKINVYERITENAKIAFADARAKADNDLNQDYNSALVYLIDASSKYNKALADLKDMEKIYFYRTTSLEVAFRDKRIKAEEAYLGVSSLNIKGVDELVDIAVSDPKRENIDSALIGMRSGLEKAIDVLDYTKKAMADASIRENVSSTDRSTIDADIANINTAYSNINTAKADIANQKIANQTNINSAENALKKAEADLEELKAAPRNVDIAVYQADVDKYSANVNEYFQKLKDASIISPFDGIIAKIDGKIGEDIIANNKTIISLISPGNFQIRADISEADIKKVNIGNPVKITLDAFPEETLTGQIIEVESGKTIVEGIVYYRVKILFDNAENKIKSGMTADTTIETNKKENVLYVPQRAISYKNDSRLVKIPKNKTIEEIKVETGLKGNNGETEIISGLKEGDKVIIYINNKK